MATSPIDSSNPGPSRKRTLKVSTAATVKKSSDIPSGVNEEARVLSSTREPFNVYDMISTAAYYLAERRQFKPGHELEDWLTAERQVTGIHSTNH